MTDTTNQGLKGLLHSRKTHALITFVFFLISFIIEVQRTARHCSVTNTMADVKTVINCNTPDYDIYCVTAAFDFKYVSYDDSGKTVMKFFCPWRQRTSALNYIAVGAALLFLTLYTVPIRFIKPIVTIVIGFIATCLTLVSFVLMAVDIANGADESKALAALMDGENVKFSNAVYIVNVVFTAVAFLMLAVFTFVVIRTPEQTPQSTPKTQKKSTKNPKLYSRYALAGIICAFFLVSFIIEVQRTAFSCKIRQTAPGVDITESFDSEGVREFCAGGSFDAHQIVYPDDSSKTEMKLHCPWRKRTSALNYISLGASLLFLTLFTKPMRQIKPVVVILSGFLAVCLTLVAVVLMAIDIANGYTQTDKMAVELTVAAGFTFNHSLFIVNVVFTGLAFLMLSLFTFMVARNQEVTTGDKVEKLQATPGQELAKINVKEP